MLFISCGLPEVAFVEPPKAIDTGGLDTELGFETPSNDEDILGYTLYYKIYAGLGADEYDTDRNAFLASNLTAGSTLPKQRGFVRAGVDNASERFLPSETGYNIKHQSGWNKKKIYIDFNANGTSVVNARTEPKIYLDAPAANNGEDYGITITRGFIDKRDNASSLLSFVNDWAYSASPGDYFDGDLLSPPPKDQPGSSSAQWTGKPIFDDASKPANILVAFVVFSTGLNTTGGGLTFLTSTPVHIGRAVYSDIQKSRDS